MSKEAEFSRVVAVDRMPPEGRALTLSATEQERGALAARFGLEGLESLVANVAVRPLGTKARQPLVEVDATMVARVRQTCVVTLVPLVREITDSVRQRYGGGVGADGAAEVDVDADSVEDPPEPLDGGHIDVGELVAELLGLAIDPHPRAEGVEFASRSDWGAETENAGDSGADRASGPFSALAALTRGGSGS